MKKRRVALFDLDNTLCDYTGALRRDLARLASSRDVPINLNFLADYQKARAAVIKQIPGWWRDLAPIEVGISILKLALDIGFECHVLTKGPWKTPSAWTEKVEWCREHLPSEVKVMITEDKSIAYGRVLVDDWPSYVHSWLEFRPRGCVLMPEMDYNSDFEHEQVFKYQSHTNVTYILPILMEAFDRD